MGFSGARPTARTAVRTGCVVAALALSGCSGQSTRNTSGPAPTRPKPAASTAAPHRVAWADPATTVRDTTTKVLVSTGRHTGGLTRPEPRTAAGAVWVATECRGDSALTVDTGAYGSYTEPCGTAPGGTLNDFDTSRGTAAGRLRVTAGPGVTWAVAIGWSRHGVDR